MHIAHKYGLIEEGSYFIICWVLVVCACVRMCVYHFELWVLLWCCCCCCCCSPLSLLLLLLLLALLYLFISHFDVLQSIYFYNIFSLYHAVDKLWQTTINKTKNSFNHSKLHRTFRLFIFWAKLFIHIYY